MFFWFQVISIDDLQYLPYWWNWIEDKATVLWFKERPQPPKAEEEEEEEKEDDDKWEKVEKLWVSRKLCSLAPKWFH